MIKEYLMYGMGREEQRVTVNGFEVLFWVSGNVLKLDNGGGCTIL